jgi:long-subunit fatty acid transport protein
VGVALGGSPLEALRLNPALLVEGDGGVIEVSVAQESEEGSLSSEIGPFSGTTSDDSEDDLAPAFAWSGRPPGGRLAWGVGAFEAAGFRVDFAQTASNPITAPQPFGFGTIQTSYEVVHVPLAIAYEASAAFSVGLAARLGQATFAADPARFATPDCASATNCTLPSVGEDRQTAIGWQVGALLELGTRFALGASYALGEEYDFRWNAAVSNPSLPTFRTHREIALTVAEPDVAAVGIVYRPTARIAVAVDGQQIAYEDAGGFDGASAAGLARFSDVTVFGLGVELQVTDAVTLRLGASQSDAAVEGDQAFFAVSAPAIVEERFAAGLSWRLGAGELDLAYLRGNEAEVSGPLVSPVGPIPGSTVGLERSSDTIAIGFRYRPSGG